MLEAIVVAIIAAVIMAIFNDEIKRLGSYLKGRPIESLILFGIIILVGLQIK